MPLGPRATPRRDELILTGEDQSLRLYRMALCLVDLLLQIAHCIRALCVQLRGVRTLSACRHETDLKMHTWNTFCCKVLTVIFISRMWY